MNKPKLLQSEHFTPKLKWVIISWTLRKV
ncbi:uncharacterized protein METZ01_LOCUS368747 [marine metagenome]|uniref:Uncharacterized protein n=1 Tax=marine metagenome TaxID=408172 RepID=A0A382T1N4_9ZZZZ